MTTHNYFNTLNMATEQEQEQEQEKIINDRLEQEKQYIIKQKIIRQRSLQLSDYFYGCIPKKQPTMILRSLHPDDTRIIM